MRFDYCPICSNKLIIKEKLGDDSNIPFCDECNRPFFPHSAPCVIVLPVTKENEVLLSKQSYGDVNKFVLTAGFMSEGESAEDACSREVLEELALNTISLKYVKSYSYAKKDTLMLGFAAVVEKDKLNLSSEISHAEWVSFSEAKELLRDSFIAKKLLEDYLNM